MVEHEAQASTGDETEPRLLELSPFPYPPKSLKNESEGVSLETYRSNLVLTCPLFRQARAQRLQALW